jgi:phosphate transport system substrate-binding protein
LLHQPIEESKQLVNTSSKRLSLVAAAAALTLVATACGGDDKGSTTTAAPTTTAAGATTTAGSTTTAGASTTGGATTTAGQVENLSATLDASGATFPKAFYEEAISRFNTEYPGVTINYAGGGSGKGRQDLADQIVQFAGTDGTIKDADLAGYKGGDVLYFPTVVAPITVSYNLPGVDSLQLSPATIAKIFQVEITKWNDDAIAADNPGVTLPDTDITVVHRSDSSGTTGNFTKFLEKSVGTDAGGEWKLGTDSTVEWSPDTQAAEGNGGVAQLIGSTEGAVGYVDLADAVKANLTFASVQNKAGKYVAATLDGASAAAAGAEIKDNLTYSAIWADGDAAYPITAQTWIITYKNQTDHDKGTAVKEFLEFILTDGQTFAADVNFAPIPADLAAKALAQLDTLQIP